MNDRPRIGKTCLVGLTYLGAHGETLSTLTLYGEITSVTASGVCCRVDNLDSDFTGRIFRVPPGLERVRPGHYRLATGEVVENPDFVGRWDIHRMGGNHVPDEE